MGIPDWAERALEAHKPSPPKRSQGGDAHRAAMVVWETYRDRFRHQWFMLEVDKWKVRPNEQASHDLHNILTAALDCAKRLGIGADPLKIIRARKDLLELDCEISNAAAKLASLLRLRDGIQNDSGVANWRQDDFGLDPMDLWDAMEMAFNPHSGSGREMPQANVWPKFQNIFDLARETSLSVPEWPDLLEQLGERFEFGTCAGEFPDITNHGSDTNKSKYSPWCRALIQILDDWQLLQCLTHSQLASLASVALDAPSGAINAKQIGALVTAHKNGK